MTRYDYIIAGAGAAGLSLLVHMIHSGRFTDKKILLIDVAPKDQNDRTWCFWEQDAGLFDSIVYKRWNKLWFHGDDHTPKLHDVSPYEYKMIRGIDFYQYCFELIGSFGNITVMYDRIDDMHREAEHVYISAGGKTFTADYIFNSIPPSFDAIKADYFLWQHFKGWTIEATEPIFNPHHATLMDFRINQEDDCRFVYVMPFSENTALVEYTVFSEKLLSQEEYKTGLANYCFEFLRLPKHKYNIVSSEFGKIPMTNFSFSRADGNIIHIGTAGGQTKASSGYTFHFIQEHSRKIVECLIANEYPLVSVSSKKFDFYDSVLLKILSEKKLKGSEVFSQMFSRNHMKDVFKFLDNETSVAEDFAIIRKLPTIDFLTAAVTHLIGSN